MHAEILTIGDELCRGEIVDTNSSWLAARLWELGVEVRWMTSCRDDRADMLRAFALAAERAGVVICSGGLGPTLDDLTVDVLAEAAGVGISVHEPSRERMEKRFAKAGYALTPNNLRQVRVPEGAEPFLNPAGQAPGFGMTLGSAHFFAMPGVPRELQAIFDSAIAARVSELAASGERIAKRVHRVFGKGESHIDHALAGLTDGVPGASLHYHVAFPETLVKLVVRDADGAAAAARLETLDTELRSRLGDLAYAAGDESMAQVLGRALRDAGATLAVAESCTGGMLGALVTDVAGSSDYFLGGWIVYANAVKERELGVPPEILRDHGAVSEACVLAMARGARARSDATYALAISGIAGPGGGTPEKPVGTIHIGLSGPTGERHRTLVFPGARDQIRRLSAYWAMAMLLREVRRG
jgi:competence/damage-inducible protein CinA-like protein